MQQNTMVDSIECCRQVKKYQKDHLLPVYSTLHVAFDLQKSRLSACVGSISWLKLLSKVIQRHMISDLFGNNFLNEFGNISNIWDWPVILQFIWVQSHFFDYWWYDCMPEKLRENSRSKRQINDMCQGWQHDINVLFQQPCRYRIKLAAFCGGFRTQAADIIFRQERELKKACDPMKQRVLHSKRFGARGLLGFRHRFAARHPLTLWPFRSERPSTPFSLRVRRFGFLTSFHQMRAFSVFEVFCSV